MIINNAVDADYVIDIDSEFEFTKGGIRLLLDTDPIAYSAAAACDTATHILKINGITAYIMEGGITDLYAAFDYTDYRDFNAMLERSPDVTYEKLVTSDGNTNMFHTIKAMIRKVIKNTQAGSVELYLTDGASNFRLTEEIATILKYKGNRSPDAKPAMLGKARDYIMEELNGIMCVGLEADDQLSIEHRASWKQAMDDALEFYCGEKVSNELLEAKAMELSKTVLATIDKDIKMCAGKFINPDQDLGIEEILPMGHVFLEIKKKKNKPDDKKLRFSGLKGFYAQLLLGDACDNIAGVYYCGDVRVDELFQGLETEEQLFKTVFREIHLGFHRENVNNMKSIIEERLVKAIASGKHGKDNVSNTAKVKKKIKDNFAKQVAYCDKHYRHWSDYKLAEDGTVSKELIDPENSVVLSISPLDYMLEVARLVYMLEVAPHEDGRHLWTPPNQAWVDEIVNEFEEENILRIPMVGAV
ncbi:hypothetical protein COPG_00080 [Colwellia phage 9A]|uniref:Uncharacterized protein n=1 Tax=Colwellia phage 9A TaxID=765765 RepID=I3UMG1_9CAUD|nr:hypothetical protein COPG_00080 [Colwellia phage 9A]AFK66676.1 hypothetical protein COPG_00080 [Colwellia phage 9A]